MKKYKHVYYYNERLKCSTCLCEIDIRQMPDGWLKGRKYGGYDKLLKYIRTILKDVHFKLACNNHFLDEYFYHINIVGKKELSLGLLSVNEDILADAIVKDIAIGNLDLIDRLYDNILDNLDMIKSINTKVYTSILG